MEKSYGTYSKKLADEIFTLARHLATDIIPHDHISTLIACRLLPVNKNVSVMTCIRTKLRFALMGNTLDTIGFRGKWTNVHLQDLVDID